ncbi:hypothetical protein RYJ27_07695 [Microbacterium limosum]|uniref:DUF6933 domain-containing protein n=1 Tax=Microbacterium limosum TaxID=3079935 RepID=A0AAU0ME52_9MICO|nr:hypothetical protein [Microbacterium sp. Y20]WOQ68609.1 hypothetical protein RYJ27_07695 [Microbacterium sp. Y20]
MLILRATKKLRDKIGGVAPTDEKESTTMLGDWYGNLIAWRRPLVLLVNARTLLPVFAPLAPAKTLTDRVPDVVASALRDHGVPEQVIDHEHARMRDIRVAPTADRQVVGVMNEFIFLAGHRRERTDDLRELSMMSAHTPCGPLRTSHTYPDRELRAFLSSLTSGN